jgi:hypothetical protein
VLGRAQNALQPNVGSSSAARPPPGAPDSGGWGWGRDTGRNIRARVSWKVAVEEIHQDCNVQDDAPDDYYDCVLPDAGGPIVLPVTEETRNHDREDETQDDLNCCGTPTVERHGDESWNNHGPANLLDRFNGATVGLRHRPRQVSRKSALSRALSSSLSREALAAQSH